MNARPVAAAALAAFVSSAPALCEEDIVIPLPRVLVHLPDRAVKRLALKVSVVASEEDESEVNRRMFGVRDQVFWVAFEFVASGRAGTLAALDARLIRERLELEIDRLVRPHKRIKVLLQEIYAE